MKEDLKILLVDDSVENIQLVSSILRNESYKVIFAKSGKKALEQIENNSIDLILLDVVMPDMNGFEVAKILKNSDKHKDIPIIFLTVNTEPEDIKKGFEIGAQDYVTKPFNSIELLSRVATHLELAISRKVLKETLNTNISLLNQYKEVVDKSLIVSKSDLKGNITYVNDAFVNISGYTREELVGKPHNVIRHIEMKRDVFKDLWKNIQNKLIWQGEVKNLRKDGSYYIVQTTIMPILDTNNNIVEYISVRHDITDIYDLQQEIEDTQKEVVFTMGSIGETRSKETGNHVKRVAEYSRVFAEHSNMNKKDIELLVQASPMHDIGKVGIPDNILHKPGKLSDDEFSIMRTHAELGHKMLAHSTRPLLKVAGIIALEHHERWDGKGYPRYLKKEEISIEGRITALADVFDALGSDRCYKQAWEDERIFDYFREQKGKQFDPNLVDIFFEKLDVFLKIRETFKDV